MGRKPAPAALAAFLILSAVSAGQTVTVGNLPPNPNFGFTQSPITAIDLSNSASQSATLTAATFTWSASPCPAAVKIKFFRPAPGPTFLLLAERGPFDVTSFTSVVFLAPAVDVQAGDLIAISRLTTCGSPVGQSPGNAAGFIGFNADVTFPVTPSQGTAFPNSTLSVQATGSASTPPPAANPAALIPVVGSTPGALGGAFFRTTVQLHNPRSTTVAGHLAYHRQGTSGTALDPTVFFSLEPGETRSIPDLLPSMGLTGLGSLDVIPNSFSALPIVAVRVFNDAGTFGTTGFVEDLLVPADALGAGETGTLVAPPDSAQFRYNVGVRTLGAGATLAITQRNSTGAVVKGLTRTYPQNYFEQRDSAAFLEGPAVSSNDTIAIRVVSGSAIVYGATIDNRTNDPSIQFARRAP
jgi:hypothetical protein